MAINKKLIFWNTQSNFSPPTSSTDTTKSVLWQSIVFFNDTKKIWTHGVYFSSPLDTLLSGYSVGTDTALAASDTILGAFGKIQAQLNAKQVSLPDIPDLAGTYTKVTVSAKGLVTAGSNPTTLAGYGITDAYTKTQINGFLYTDTRTITPTTWGAGSMQFGFTSKTLNNVANWADFIRFGGYTSSTGGRENIILFFKDGFGLRQYQGDFDSASYNHGYVDYWHSGNFNPDTYSPTSHNHSLDSLSNVTITSIANGELLVRSGSSWINRTLSEAGIAAASSLSNYLPLSGGILSGGLQVNSYLRVNTEPASYGVNTGYIYFGSGAIDRWIGYDGLNFRIQNGDGSKVIYHAGNLLNIGTTASSARTALGLGTMATETASNYLPLSGGYMTLEGIIRKKAFAGVGSWSRLILRYENSNATISASMGAFGASDSISYMYLGFNAYDGNNLRVYPDKVQFGNSLIYHSGNSNSSSVAWAASTFTEGGTLLSNKYLGINATAQASNNSDKLDGYHYNQFGGYVSGVTDIHAIGGQNLYTFFSSASTPANSPVAGTPWVQGIQFPYAENGLYRQIIASASGNLYWESQGNGTWGGWRKLWDSGNSNLTTVPWSAQNLTLAGSITGATTGSFSSTVSATSFIENGTALASKYLGLNANAVSASLLSTPQVTDESLAIPASGQFKVYRTSASTATGADGYINSWTWGGGSYVTQLYVEVDPTYNMSIRHRNDAGNWVGWKKIWTEANFTPSNYALVGQTMYIGTTALAINRASLAQTLTGVSIDGNAATSTNSDKLDGLHSTAFSQEFHYGTTASNSGWYKINILSATSWMLSFTIRIYQSYQYYDVVVSGYNNGANYWYSPQATMISSTASTIQVKFGYDSAYNLWVAVPASSYTGITICNVNNGHTQVSDWSTRFSITNMATLTGTEQVTITAKRPLIYDENAIGTQQALTFNNAGGGNSSGSTFNGSAARTISYNSIGAAATNQTMYIGTTALAINRTSASLSLTGVNIDGNSGSASKLYKQANYASGNLNYRIPWWDTVGDAAGNFNQYSTSTLYFQPANGALFATSFNGVLNGNATTASSCSGNAASSTLNYVNDYNSTTVMRILGSHNGINSNGNIYSTANITMRMDIGTIYATTFSGALSGNATTATNLANINTTFTGTYPLTVNASGTIYSHTGLTFTGSTGTLSASIFSGSFSGSLSGGTVSATTGSFSGTVTFNKNTPSGTAYNALGIQVYSSDGSPVGIGFHRSGYTQTILSHEGNGLVVRSGTISTGALNPITASSFIGSLSGNADTSTKSGNSSIWFYAENNNEINFGGSSTSTSIYFGYRAKDSRAIPTEFIFGGGGGTATLKAAAYNENGTLLTNKYLRLSGGTLTGKVTVPTATRSAGIYGAYDSTKIGHVWSMGVAYSIDDSGATFGGLYGIAYKHTNNATGGTMAGGHQIVFAENGVPHSAIGLAGGFWTSGQYTGAGTGLTGTAASLNIGGNAATASKLYKQANWAAANANYRVPWWDTTGDAAGNFNQYSTSTFYFQPLSGALFATSFNGILNGNASTVTNATFYRQFTVRDDRSDGGNYNLAARPTGLYAISGAGSNGPGTTYLSLLHIANGTDVAFQIAGGYTSDNMYFRGTSNLAGGTAYTTWRTVWHNGNFTPGSYSLTSHNHTGTYAPVAQTMYIGTTAVAINRASAAITLAGTSISGSAGSATYAGYLTGTSNSATLATNTSGAYGPWMIGGSKNSYGGIYDTYSGVTIGMLDSSGNGGFYRELQGKWYFYYHLSNTCLGINSSITSSSYGMYVSGGVYSTGNIVAYSDARKKENIMTVHNALETVLKMRGVFYNKIDDPTKKRQLGVIAQEMEVVLPEVVTYASDIDEYGVAYGNLSGIFIQAFKEQQSLIDKQSEQINELKEMVQILTFKIL